MKIDVITKPRLPHDLMALRVVREFRSGMVVNLGIGLPTLVSDHVPTNGAVMLHSENGMIGYGPFPTDDKEGNPNIVNAGGQMVTLIPGASFVHHADSFAIIRGGYIDVAVLGALQVSEKGDLANYLMPGRALGSPGGAVDLAAQARRVIVLMEHTTREGQPKIVRDCTIPLTGRTCVSLVITDVGVFEVDEERVWLREIAPGWTVEEIQSITDVPLLISLDLKEMHFDREEFVPVDKAYTAAIESVEDVFSGAVIMVDGFCSSTATPQGLMRAIVDKHVNDLTLITNLGSLENTIDNFLIQRGRVRRLIASASQHLLNGQSHCVEGTSSKRNIEIELVSEEALAERIRMGGAGIIAAYLRNGSSANGELEQRIINGHRYSLEYALRADFALIRAQWADSLGNLIYGGYPHALSAKMATAATITIAEVDEILPAGNLDPELIDTPGLYVDRIVHC
jgi:3-oxoacid CoA-transferase subunit B